MKKNLDDILLLFFSITTLFAANVHAEYSVTNGSNCIPSGGAAFTNFIYDTTGVRNNSSLGKRVTCPVVRDNGFFIFAAEVRIAGPGSVSCYLDNISPSGGYAWWDSGSGDQFNPAFIVIDYDSNPHTSYAFDCYLPVNTKIVSYEIFDSGF